MSYLDMVRRITSEGGSPESHEALEVAKKAKKVPAARCVECGQPIAAAEPECWWGLDRVHVACGKAAWAREWRGEVLPADVKAEH